MLFFRFSQLRRTNPYPRTLDLGHRVRAKWDECPNLTPTHFTAIFPQYGFCGTYNSAGVNFQESRVVLNDSAFKNGWGKVFSKMFRHKQGSNEQKTGKKAHFSVLVGCQLSTYLDPLDWSVQSDFSLGTGTYEP